MHKHSKTALWGYSKLAIIGGVAVVARLPRVWLLLRDYRSWRFHCISRTGKKL